MPSKDSRSRAASVRRLEATSSCGVVRSPSMAKLSRRGFAVGLGVAAASLAVVSCSAGTGDDATGSGAGSAANSSGGSTSTFSGGSGGNSGCEQHCSADLHSLLDCNDQLLMTCPPDQGCSPDGTCVPACESARLNKSTIGCDFFSATTAIIPEGRGSCFTAMIANTWTSPITVTAEFNGTGINAAAFTYVPQGSGASLTYQPLTNGMLQPGELGLMMLSQYDSGDVYQVPCPVPSALNISTQVDGTGRGGAFQITTSAPVVAYDVYPWGGASSYATSATLLLPTPTWGTNFVTADGWTAENGQPFTQIVASEDGTTVTFVPKSAVAGGGGVPGMPANTASTFALNRGEMVQIVQGERLAGSLLQADKPVSVWGGATCMNIPTGLAACDAGHQQLLPVQTLGSQYVAVRYPSRGGDDQAPYTFVGMVDGTTLTYDPMPSGAPTTLAIGQVAIFSTTEPFTVRSQDADHPFYVAAHMTGGETNGAGLGDPEYVNVVPPEQYLPSYLFVTDPTYAFTSLVFTRKKGKDGFFKDVTLDCMGAIAGWVQVGTGGEFEVARIPMVQNGAGVGSCNNGVHTATSEVPFGLTVWGYDSYASYAYPAGMSVEPINSVIVPPIPQ